MSQLDFFLPPPSRDGAVYLKPPRRQLTREEMLAHKWYGNRCPGCGAPAGEGCRPARPGRDGLHGMRTRFLRPGLYMAAEDDPWPHGRNQGAGYGAP
jgi:hypothetical protein